MPFLVAWLRRTFGSAREDGHDTLAALILAAREDPAFHARVVAVLRLPAAQRASLVNTAVHEMRLRGESVAAQEAFSVLATEEGARTALKLLAPPV